MFAIEKGIPVSYLECKRKGVSKYPFKLMVKGDSFFVPFTCNFKSLHSLQNTILASCRQFKERNKDIRAEFCSSQMKKENGVRVWRVV